MKTIFNLFFLLISFNLVSQSVQLSESIKNDFTWNAYWITPHSNSLVEYGIFHFRNQFEITKKPDQFIICVSADNRYRLFVNGTAVCFGPARGDLLNWRYEEIDIAPFLQSGKNTLAALVWNASNKGSIAQISKKTAFVLCTKNKDYENSINTGLANWKCIQNNAYSPIDPKITNWYFVAGFGDKIDASNYPWGWETEEYNDTHWLPAIKLSKAVLRGYPNDAAWFLTPRTIPMMEETKQTIPNVRKTVNIQLSKEIFPITIKPEKKVRILFDNKHLTIGYPELLLNKGKNAVITITYAESLFDSIELSKNKYEKGNRDSIKNKIIVGYTDQFISDGGINRLFRPLWMRTFRYVQLDIETQSEELTIQNFYSIFTAYPFKKIASFESNNSSLNKIFETGWRTARLCAVETYFDCPYYEQLQYIGDTRIQALISLYVSGDDRLMRNALTLFNDSRIPDGLTQSRYPSSQAQIIPPFSLYWVNMVNDYYMHRDDSKFVKSLLPGIRSVLTWFENRIDTSGMIKMNYWWNFVDWTPSYQSGVPHGAANTYSSILNLQYAKALQDAAFLFKNLGYIEESNHYILLFNQIKTATLKYCFDNKKKLMAQSPTKDIFSQHANIMAILTDCFNSEDEKIIMNTILIDSSLIKASIYYQFYLFRALKKTGLQNKYLSLLGDWDKMIKMGMTTFGEELSKPRSDCHAWSASPCYDLFAIVSGIEPDSPGFKTVKIEPSFGNLTIINASMPHPFGQIKVNLTKKENGIISGTISLPIGLSGRFLWNNKTINLKSGDQLIEL